MNVGSPGLRPLGARRRLALRRRRLLGQHERAVMGRTQSARHRRTQGHGPHARAAGRHGTDGARRRRAGRTRQAAHRHDRARCRRDARLGPWRAARAARDATGRGVSRADAQRRTDSHRRGRVGDDRVQRRNARADERPRPLSAARHHAVDEGWRERVQGLRGLLTRPARSSRAGRPEHVRRRRLVSRSGRHAVTRARRRRQRERDSVDAGHRSRCPESRTAAARHCRDSSGGRTRRSV